MRNEEKYKTAEERVEAFNSWCKRGVPGENACHSCALIHSGAGENDSIYNCWAYWLALEAEDEKPDEAEDEKPEPCPFCGGKCTVEDVCTNEDQTSKYICCSNEKCMYQSANGKNTADAIAAHNRVATAHIREATARLRKPCAKNYKCDSLEEMLARSKREIDDLRRRLKVAEVALVDMLGGECGSLDKVETARNALAAIREEGGANA